MDKQSEEIDKKENYNALVEFFRKDTKIKNILVRLAPKSEDEYDENSRMEYLDKLYAQLKGIENDIIEVLQKFKLSEEVISNFEKYFETLETKFLEMGYSSPPKSLSEIYQQLFTNMNPELVEKVKRDFVGYTLRWLWNI